MRVYYRHSLTNAKAFEKTRRMMTRQKYEIEKKKKREKGKQAVVIFAYIQVTLSSLIIIFQ